MSKLPQTRGEQTSQEILRAAYDLFVQQGYHGTSMRQIAQDAGIALGGIYNHFSSKEEIFRNVFITYHPLNDFFPAMINDAEISLDVLIHNALKNIKSSLDKRPGFLNLFFIEVVEFNTVHVKELFSQYFPRGLKMIQHLQEKDARLRDIPPAIIARAIIGMIFTYYLTERLIAPVAPPEFQENSSLYYANILIYGILSGEKTLVNNPIPGTEGS